MMKTRYTGVNKIYLKLISPVSFYFSNVTTKNLNYTCRLHYISTGQRWYRKKGRIQTHTHTQIEEKRNLQECSKLQKTSVHEGGYRLHNPSSTKERKASRLDFTISKKS